MGITSPYGIGILARSANTTGAAAKLYEDRKNAKYRAVGASCYKHVPLIQESSGRLGGEAWKALKKIAEHASAGGVTAKSDFVTVALGMLAMSNVRATYKLVRAYSPVHSRLVGSALVPGVRVPTDDVSALCTT